MPDVGGIEAIARIRADDPQAKIIVLTSFADDDKIFPAIRAGAAGYLMKDVSPKDLARAIRMARDGEPLLHPDIVRRLMDEVSRPAQPELADAPHPARERCAPPHRAGPLEQGDRARPHAVREDGEDARQQHPPEAPALPTARRPRSTPCATTWSRLHMANLIYSVICSLDGYIEDAGGSFDWAAPDEEVHAFVNDLERPIGTYLYGRRMYETMLYWETAHTIADHPIELDYAMIWQAADKVVYSRTLDHASSARTRIERAFDRAEVRRMKWSSPRDISVGGPELARTRSAPASSMSCSSSSRPSSSAVASPPSRATSAWTSNCATNAGSAAGSCISGTWWVNNARRGARLCAPTSYVGPRRRWSPERRYFVVM